MEKIQIDYDQITQTILEHIEKRSYLQIPCCFAEIGMPKNFVSCNDYSGQNLLRLASRRFVSPWFLTFLQAKELGGNIRRGEKGLSVLKFGEQESETPYNLLTEPKRFIKRYTVFNSSQIEGIDFPEIKPPRPENHGQLLESAESMISQMVVCPEIHEGRKAVPCYNRKLDSIEMPGREFFSNLQFYYKTLFHEIVHYSGHQSRLARKTLLEGTGRKSDKVAYAKEELVAEFGASFMATMAGVQDDNHRESAGYIAGWLSSIHADDDRQSLLGAAKEAENAVKFLLGLPA